MREVQFDFFGETQQQAPQVAAEIAKKVITKKTLNYLENVDGTLLDREVIKFTDIYEHDEYTAPENVYTGGKNTGTVMKNLHSVKSHLISIIGEQKVQQFIDSMDFRNETHVIPISGGADSTGIAIIMRALFPMQPFVFVFTDTKAESPGLYYQLNLVEEFLGVKINRVIPELGLYEMIEKYNGFLPSQKARYCTSALKIKPLLKWFKSNFDSNERKIINHVGIRYDEDRGGMMAEDENVQTRMPYMKLKMGKMEVFALLLKTIGIPSFYKWKTRSGCISCFFLRRSEKSAQLFHEPREFTFVKWTEKLSKNDIAKYGLHWNEDFRQGLHCPRTSIPFSKANNLYPVITAVDPRTRNENLLELETMQNTNKERIFVGIAMYCPRYTLGIDDHLVYKQEFAVYSFTKHHLKMQLQTWYEHQSANYILKGFTSLEEFERDINLVCFEIEIDKALGVALKSKPDSESFTNSQTECYAQIESITKLANAVLVFERTKQDWETYKKYYPQGEYDPICASTFETTAVDIKKQLDKQRAAMKLLNNPTIRNAETVNILSQDEILDRQLKKTSIDVENTEAITVCAMCSI